MAYSKQNFQNGQILNAANLEKMENGIIAGQGAENLLDNSNFRDPVNSRGKNAYSDAGNEYTIDRWKTQSGTNISIENGYINIIGQGELYQIIQNPKDGIYTFAARIRINSIGQFTPFMGVNNGSNTGRQINLDADIGEWKTYILQYDLSSMTAETIKFLLSPRGGNTTASISVEWAAMYKGAYTANTLPAYVPKGKHVEMLNCGVSLQPHNLLDNSDFRDPVNSRGITSTEASGYHIDRWKKENESGKVTVGNGYLSMTGTGAYWFLTQYIEPKKIKSGAVYTIALADTSGSISICSTVMSTNMTKFTARHTFTSGAVVITNVEYTSDKYSIYFTSNSSKETRFAWAVLYEGAYTADTLPPYAPKGKHVEMLNCNIPLAPRNLLDNSDFRIKNNIINTKGLTDYSFNSGDVFDRWRLHWTGDGRVSIKDGYIELYRKTHSAYLFQHPRDLQSMVGKTYTLAAKVRYRGFIGWIDSTQEVNCGLLDLNDWDIIAFTFTVGSATSDIGEAGIEIGTQKDSSFEVQWVALYEGVYTKETLPAYVAKGKHIEMLNCNVPLAPYNLLDNSDFTNPVNQRGKTSYSGNVYTIDRWKLNENTLNVGSVGITLVAGDSSAAVLTQYISGLRDGVYTQALNVNGKICTRIIQLSGSTITTIDSSNAAYTGGYVNCTVSNSGYYSFHFRALEGYSITVRWAALYEGSYNTDTLPSYVPKGKHVEMLNCGVLLQPKNLLDNSDFINPVNQRGQTSYTGEASKLTYTIDRWNIWSTYPKTEVTASGLKITGIDGTGYIAQLFEKPDKMVGKTYTLAAGMSNGTILCGTATVPSTTQTGEYYISAVTSSDTTPGLRLQVAGDLSRVRFQFSVKSGKTCTIAWAALYEGSYDASTLPAYQPKGYAAELAECQRYYRNIRMNAIKERDSDNLYSCSFPIYMRATPTVKLIKFSPYGESDITTFTNCSVSCDANNIFYARLPTCTAHNVGGLFMELSADL